MYGWTHCVRAALVAASGLALGACQTMDWPPPGLFHSVPGETLRTPAPEVPPAAAGGPVIEIRPGDTLTAIARRTGTTIADLIAANDIASPDRIYAGQTLALPGGAETAETVETAVASPPPKPRAKPSGTPARGKSRAASRVGPKPAASPSPPKARPVSQRLAKRIPPPPPRAGGRFAWPVTGRVVSGYGAKGKGLRNDGINIAAKRGATVKAADNGVVVYAGNELPGFGNLLLVKHAGGWFTAYGHNELLLVERGTRVRKGQRIATVGSTGSVTTPQLHFEVRKGRRALDPGRHLARRS